MYSRIIIFLLCLILHFPFTSYAKLKLGAFTFAEAPAKALDISTPLYKGLESLHFINQVGGVAFDGIARSAGSTTWTAVALEYDAGRIDGERLHIVFTDSRNSKYEVVAPIYNWQLFPIVRFANSEASACATSQGELVDEALQKRHLSSGDWILNYHPAFENTLLGLRLVQADFLGVIPEACDLPQSYDVPVLGEGEQRPNIQSNRQSWLAYQEAARKIQEAYTAFVICDHQSPVLFSIKANKLILTGEPVWCYLHVQQTVADSLEVLLAEEVKRRKQELNAADTENIEPGKVDYVQNARVYQQLLNEYTEEYLENRRAELVDALPPGKRLQQMHLFSAKMTGLIRRYRNMNAQVYDALTTTMRYAAFFRWVKRLSPTSLQSFMDSAIYYEPLQNSKTPSLLIVKE